LSWLLAFAGFAALIILHEFGHFAAAKAVGMRVERFALFFPPLIWKVKRGETEYGVGAIPLGGYVRITGMNPNEEIPPELVPRAYYNQPVWKRIVVIAAGPVMNVLVALFILWALFVFKGQQEISAKVDQIERGSPSAGRLLAGDTILAVDGRRGSIDDFANQIARHRCPGGAKVDGCRAATIARVTVRRDGRTQTLRIRPVYDGQQKRARIGFRFGVVWNRDGPIAGIGTAADRSWQVTKATISALGKIVYDKKARDEVSGVVGSYETTRQTIKTNGFVDTMLILAVISLSLAIVNLFPFLPLDGGHIFWALAEKLRGRAIPFSVMERASVVGFFLVILLFAVGLSNDIDHLRNEGFGAR
jgi:regulator of sigma E protease